MRNNVQVTAGAERDLVEIMTFLMERKGAAFAEKILEGILDSAAEMAQFPERGSHPKELLALGIKDFRQMIFHPYRLIYRVEGRKVFLYLVADGRRDFQSLLERRLLRG